MRNILYEKMSNNSFPSYHESETITDLKIMVIRQPWIS